MTQDHAGTGWLDDAPPHSDADAPGGRARANGHDHAAEQPKATVTYPMVWFDEINELSSAEHLVEDLLGVGSLFVVYGESNSGKTFLMLDIALAVSQGYRWRGKDTQKGVVLYVAGEGATSVKNRVLAYRKIAGVKPEHTDFSIIPLAVDFTAMDCVLKLVETVKEAEAKCGNKIVMVVVDTLARAMVGHDENASLDMGLVVAAADLIRAQTGAAVGFVHHSGKDAARGARGSNALRAATDTEISVEGTQGQRLVTVTKQRDMESGGKMPFTLKVVELGTNAKGKMITSCVVNHIDEMDAPAFTPEPKGQAQRTILAAMRERTKNNPGKMWTITELRTVGKEGGMSKATAVTVVDWLTTSPFMTPSVGGHLFTDGSRQGGM